MRSWCITHQEGNIYAWASLRKSVSFFQMRTLNRPSPQAPPGTCYLLPSGSLRSEISPFRWRLPQQRKFAPQRPVTLGQQSPSCLPYPLLFCLCLGRKEGARAPSRAAWTWGPGECMMGMLGPIALIRVRCLASLHPVLSSGAISPPMCTVVAGCSRVPLSCCVWKVCICGHLPQLRPWF